MNTFSRAVTTIPINSTSPGPDVNLIAVTLILCITIVALAWILTRHRLSTNDNDKVLCFVSLGMNPKGSSAADRINRHLSIKLGGISVVGAFPSGSNSIKLVSSCGPVLYRSILISELTKLDFRDLPKLKDVRALLNVSNRFGSRIKRATQDDLRNFKNFEEPEDSWSTMGSFHDREEPIFFTINGLTDKVLIMCIQYPNCPAHRNAPKELLI